jgi:parallel beta helix pectate lyase-like protein
MTVVRTGLQGIAVAALFGLMAAHAEAQATRTWVSGVGDDVNPCSRTAPCKTFAGAISKTAVHGEINCLDPGGFGAVTITKSITIDCHEIVGSTLNSLVTGVIINFDNFTAAGEVQKTVRLRNINFNGANTGTNGIRIIGGAAATGTEVFIEDCLIDGNFGSPGRGISDERSGGGELNVSNTTIRNNTAEGIRVVPASGTVKVDATLENVRVHNSNVGVLAGGSARVMINRSVVSGNTGAGVQADGGSRVNFNSSVSSSNGTGLATVGGIIRFSDSDIVSNATALSGPTLSFQNNRITGNTAAGTAPSPANFE